MNKDLFQLYEKDSGNQDLLILTDEADAITGYLEKAACHKGGGQLHQAFSIFIFDDALRLLLHRRAASKPLWPLFWTNTVCSHPRKGEERLPAAYRRLKEEMGLECASGLHFLFKFQYAAAYRDIGSENELCAVFVGRTNQPPAPDPHEIDAFRYIKIPDLDQELNDSPEQFTPWFKIEWSRIRQEFLPTIKNLPL